MPSLALYIEEPYKILKTPLSLSRSKIFSEVKRLHMTQYVDYYKKENSTIIYYFRLYQYLTMYDNNHFMRNTILAVFAVLFVFVTVQADSYGIYFIY